jgi:hypothetical protein
MRFFKGFCLKTLMDTAFEQTSAAETDTPRT